MYERQPYKPRCGPCGEKYDLDNVYICSGCGTTYCYKCVWDLRDMGAGTEYRWICKCAGLVK